MTVTAPAAEPATENARFGLARTALLIAATVAVDTFVNALSAEKLNFLYKEVLGLSASAFASFGILLNIPQYLRPFIGTLSDLVPLAGYHRRSYYALAVLAEAGALFTLSTMPHYSYAAVAALVVTQTLGIVLMFLMMEAVLVRTGNATGMTGRLQTVQQFVRYALITTCTAHLSGYVTQHWSYHACLRAAALVTLAALPCVLLIDEKRAVRAHAAHETPEQRAARLRDKREDHAHAFAALRAGARSPGLWAVVGFIFYLILTPGSTTAQFYYQVDHLHFSKQLLGDLTAFAAAGSVLGFLTYAAFSPRLPARALILGLIVLDCVSYVLLLGLRDPLSAKVIAVAGGVVYGWYLLGLLTIGARVCPPGIEGTVYGLVYAAQFLGGTLSDKLGSTVYDRFGGAHGHPAQGWHALLIAAIAFSALAALFIPFLPAWARSRSPLGALKEEQPG
jgi:predicted MFS family arabinose efflux permease